MPPRKQTHSEAHEVADEPKEESVAQGPQVLVKWMGDADVRVINKGDTFEGRLPDGLERRLEWNWDNNHVLDIGDLDPEVVELVLSEPDLKDVTGLKTVPDNAVSKRRRARPGVQETNFVGGTIASSGTGAGLGTANTGEGSTP